MQNSLSKIMADLEAMMDLYGKDAVLNALAEIASGPEAPVPHMSMQHLKEGKTGLAAGIASNLFNIITKAAGGTAKIAAKPVATAMDKALDQDVHISSQGPVLKVTDPGLYELISQTNALIARTNELLSGATDAIDSSNKELQDIDISIDDLIAAETPGAEMSDVGTRQAAGLPPEKMPDDDEQELPPSRERV
jgi:hypothetical protein